MFHYAVNILIIHRIFADINTFFHRKVSLYYEKRMNANDFPLIYYSMKEFRQGKH